MEFKRITTADDNLYRWAEELLVEAFPVNERRDLPQQRINTDSNPYFSCTIIEVRDCPIGILNYWNFYDFYYIEHFAISPQKRNAHYGSKALALFIASVNKPIVIEVEYPTMNEWAQKRIDFYERAGFLIDKHDYFQPPYRKSEKAFPMLLMYRGELTKKCTFEFVKKKIHTEVYGIK